MKSTLIAFALFFTITIQDVIAIELVFRPKKKNKVEKEEEKKSKKNTNASGYFVSIGNGAHRMVSEDGVNWKHHEFLGKPGHDQNDLKAIARGNGVTVAVGGFSKSNIFVTKDGRSWEKLAYNMGVLSGCVFVKGQFVIFGEGGRIAISKDGRNWQRQGDSNPVGTWAKAEAQRLGLDKLKSNIRAWRYANGVYVGSGDNSIVCSTKDLRTFNFVSDRPNGGRLYIETNGSSFVIFGKKYAAYSVDGETWKEVTPEGINAAGGPSSVDFDGERYIMTSHKPDVAYTSYDGLKWEKLSGVQMSSAPWGNQGKLITTPKAYFKVAASYKYSEGAQVSFDQGKSWKEMNFPAPAGIVEVLYVTD